jgi:Meiotically Up-regulated Gene 113 (MUG113) protein
MSDRALRTKSGLPKHCTWAIDRHGQRRVRFRRGAVSRYIPGIPWSEEFMRFYASALEVIGGKPRWDRCHRRQKVGDKSVVYFVRIGEAIKIGYSTRLKGTLQSFRSASAHVTVLGVSPGDRDTERRLHQQFAKDRIKNELFRSSAAIKGFLHLVKQQSIDFAFEKIEAALASLDPDDFRLVDRSNERDVTLAGTDPWTLILVSTNPWRRSDTNPWRPKKGEANAARRTAAGRRAIVRPANGKPYLEKLSEIERPGKGGRLLVAAFSVFAGLLGPRPSSDLGDNEGEPFIAASEADDILKRLDRFVGLDQRSRPERGAQLDFSRSSITDPIGWPT